MIKIIEQLVEKGVVVPDPLQLYISEEIDITRIEAGVILHPGTRLSGKKTLLGSGSCLGKEFGGSYEDVRCGRNVYLGSGSYQDCVFLDNVVVRSGAEIRKGTLFMEYARAGHTVGCKMSIVSMHATLGSLINFCDIFISGGTGNSYDFTEIGSGAIHYNFTPNGVKFGSLIGPGSLGEMTGLFSKVFVGGQTQIIAPTKIGHGTLIPAGIAVREIVPQNTIAISPALKVGQKIYHKEIITNVIEKVVTTMELIIHYAILANYFCNVRQTFAKHHNDSFSIDLYEEAINNIQQNIAERMNWLFAKKDADTGVDFFSKLAISLTQHYKLYNEKWKEKAIFHLKNIEEHEKLISSKAKLQKALTKILENINVDFFAIFELFLGSENNYPDFVYSLPSEIKENIVSIWKEYLNLENIQNILNDTSESSFSKKIENYKKYTNKTIPFLQKMHNQNQLLVDFSQLEKKLGIINNDLNAHSDLLATSISLCPNEKSTQVIKALSSVKFPVVIDWKMLKAFLSKNKLEDSFIEKATFRVHGTDGIRGNIFCSTKPISYQEAIVKYVTSGDITPELFTLLAYATIVAFEKKYAKKAFIAVAKDTRDLYATDPLRSDCLYTALKKGAAYKEKIYDLGEMPIANVPYVLTHCDVDNSKFPINMILYKSASHNPASQDGLKIFIKNEAGHFVKATQNFENIITSYMFCHSQDLKIKKSQDCISIKNIALKIFNAVMTNIKNLPNTMPKNTCVICDLSHGAFAAKGYREILHNSFKICGIEDIHYVGDAPNGQNINNNFGEDRVGAAHFENVEKIERKDIEIGGKFFGFPALKKLFSYKNDSEKNVFAIFMDGDGDRGITVFYNSLDDVAFVLDGDKSLFLQIHSLVENKELVNGDTIAFTADSSVPFMNAVKECVEKEYSSKLIIGKSSISPNDIKLQVSPIGDKYILEKQCFGGEKSGHIIRENHMLDEENKARKLYVGNGFLANLHTVGSIGSILQKKSRQETYSQIANLYEKPKSITVYVYFVKKELWYQDSILWQKVSALLEKECNECLEKTVFPQEPDSLFYCSYQEKVNFTILARPSGTENKMGIKFSGTDLNITQFKKVSEKVFFLLAKEMKNFELSSSKQENEILRLVVKESSVAKIKKDIIKNDDVIANTHFFSIIGALAKQKLVNYDGTTISLLPRGKKYLGLH